MRPKEVWCRENQWTVHFNLVYIAALQAMHSAQCIVSSLHKYNALVAAGIRDAVTTAKEAVDVHFNAPCLSRGAGGDIFTIAKHIAINAQLQNCTGQCFAQCAQLRSTLHCTITKSQSSLHCIMCTIAKNSAFGVCLALKSQCTVMQIWLCSVLQSYICISKATA